MDHREPIGRWITSQSYHLLLEAFERFECFHVRSGRGKWTEESLRAAWTGYGSATKYAPAVKGGYMTPVTRIEKGTSGWFHLTPRGAEIVLRWHGMGYNCGDGQTVIGKPPRKRTIEPPMIEDNNVPDGPDLCDLDDIPQEQRDNFPEWVSEVEYPTRDLMQAFMRGLTLPDDTDVDYGPVFERDGKIVVRIRVGGG